MDEPVTNDASLENGARRTGREKNTARRGALLPEMKGVCGLVGPDALLHCPERRQQNDSIGSCPLRVSEYSEVLTYSFFFVVVVVVVVPFISISVPFSFFRFPSLR